MAAGRSSHVLRHSVLDRLAGTGTDSAGRRELRIGVDELRQAVRRDLEWLLNTRRIIDARLDDYEEISRSILTYGLPDLNPYSRTSVTDRASLCRTIEEAIGRFEPRLDPRTIQVQFLPNRAVDDFAVHFRISGIIRVDPIREPISFDTSMDPNSGMMEVEEADDA
jgi:type VI secretion system protein ImpF